MSEPFDALIRELDAWGNASRVATLWWRDDDAVEDTYALRRLLALAEAHDAPVALAAIPALVKPTLSDALRTARRASILQHGYAHINHAPRGAGNGAWELGPHQPKPVVLAELQRGRDILDAQFGPRFVPAITPPWNRIDPALFTELSRLGFIGVSTFGARAAIYPVEGFIQANCHIDIVKWKRDRQFVGAARAVADIVAHLAARREARSDPDEPTGLLTHHLALDDAAWDFFEALARTLKSHSAARWLTAAGIFGDAREAGAA
ncbi:MAG: polysaccharide deacetylase family protein [Alphaproteobacteria bacterium]